MKIIKPINRPEKVNLQKQTTTQIRVEDTDKSFRVNVDGDMNNRDYIQNKSKFLLAKNIDAETQIIPVWKFNISMVRGFDRTPFDTIRFDLSATRQPPSFTDYVEGDIIWINNERISIPVDPDEDNVMTLKNSKLEELKIAIRPEPKATISDSTVAASNVVTLTVNSITGFENGDKVRIFGLSDNSLSDKEYTISEAPSGSTIKITRTSLTSITDAFNGGMIVKNHYLMNLITGFYILKKVTRGSDNTLAQQHMVLDVIEGSLFTSDISTVTTGHITATGDLKDALSLFRIEQNNSSFQQKVNILIKNPNNFS